MKSRNLFLIPLIIFAGCKKKDDPTPTSNEDQIVTENEYYPTSIGNYWVYEHYQVNLSTGEETKLSLIDSIVVTGDTLIDGKKYAVLEGINRPFNHSFGIVNFVRDSSGCLLNNRHDVLLSSENFTDTLGRFQHDDTLNNILSSSVWWMVKGEQTLEVPAGTFNCIVLQTRRTQNYYETSDVKSMDWRSCYAKGIGPVMLEYNYQYLADVSIREKRLVRYHVKSENQN